MEERKEKKSFLEAKKWLYKHSAFAEKWAENVTDQLTLSSEFFSRDVLESTLSDTADVMTPENTGLAKAEIEELKSLKPRERAFVVSALSDLICESSPSVKDKKGRTVYTTREIVDAERNILIQAQKLANKSTDGQPFANVGDIRTAVDEVDSVLCEGSGGKFSKSERYKRAFDSFLEPSFLQIANGPPGCGKSTLAQGLVYALTKDATENGRPVPRFFGTAPSSKAAGGIVEDMKFVTECCHSVTDKMAAGESLNSPVLVKEDVLKTVTEKLPEIQGGKSLDKMVGDIDTMNAGDVLIVDEAGLIGAKQMSFLLTKANDKGIRLFMLGDNLQIPPAMAGNGFDELLAKKEELGIKTTELQVVLRQKDPDEAQWTLDIRAGDPKNAGKAKDTTMRALNGYAQRYYTGFDEKGKARYEDVGAGKIPPAGSTPGLQFIDDVHERLAADYIEFRTKYPQRSSVIVATTDKAAEDLSSALREKMIEKGLIRDVKRFGGIEMGTGDLVMLKEIGSLPVMKKENGAFVPVKADDITSGDQLEIVGFDEKTKQVTFKKNRDEFVCDAEAFGRQAKYALALPLYEAQGVSRDRTFMAVTEAGHMDKVHAGVAFSRHEQQMSAYVSKAAYPDGMVGLAKEMRVFSTRKQLYSDGKSVTDVLNAPELPSLHTLLKQKPAKGMNDAVRTKVLNSKARD